MVYGGKPSRGCQMCRIRRIKCDETKPTCKQCAKARRVCPGYRDVNKSHPTSEGGSASSQVPDKPQQSATPSLAPKSGRSDGLSLEGTGTPSPRSSSDKSIQAPPPLAVDELASCHFISNYVLIPKQGLATTRGFLEFVLPLLKTPEPSQHFLYAFKACSLASLNNRVGTGNDFDRAALGCYTKALACTFTALKDPVLTKRDDTLAAILLLGLFENITAKTLGMLAWSSHIEGAIQLVKSRGQEQLRSKIGLDLFIAVRTQMIIHSLSTGKPPTLDVDWWVTDPGSNEYSMQLQQLSSRVGELKSEVNALLATVTRSSENMELMKDTIQNCKSLDKEIVTWLRELPEQYMWKTVAWEPYNPRCDYSKAEVFPGRIDAYVDLWVVNFWNVMRCMRIVLASLTIRCTAWINFPADYRTTSEYATTVRTCVEAISDIIASVPYQMGLFSKRKDLRSHATHSVFGCGEDTSEKGLAGYFLLWPLACIQGQDYLTDSQRAWVKGRLKSIGNTLGVRYGNLLSQLNVRVPSMLILRDRLKNDPHEMPADIAAIMAGTAASSASPPSAGASTAGGAMPPGLPGMSNPGISIPGMSEIPSAPGASADALANQEAIRRQMLKRQTEELVTKAVEKPGKLDDWTVKTWLQL
ncbi:putative negative acting factor [Metarhizium anisopliae]